MKTTKTNRAVSILMVLVIALSAITLGFTSASAAETGTVDGTFSYRATDDENGVAPFHYRDSYFDTNSKEYNPSLSTMSLCLELSAFSSYGADNENQSENAKALFEKIGFNDFTINDEYKSAPTKDSIGVAVARKEINDYTVIGVAIRGGYYEKEWASNVTVGNTGNHEGFNRSANKVIDFVKKYIEKLNNHENVKLWIVGYSRGGAVANLTGKWFDDNQEITGITNSRIYTYTFEAPQPALESEVKGKNGKSLEKYTNIHNVVNDADIVTKVAFSNWGFTRAGDDYSLPSTSDRDYEAKRNNMLQYRKSLTTSGDYQLDAAKKYLKEEPAAFLNRFVGYIADKVSRSKYVDKYQDDAVKAMLKSREELGVADILFGFGGLIASITVRHPIDTYSFYKVSDKLYSIHDPENCLAWLMSFDNNYAA